MMTDSILRDRTNAIPTHAKTTLNQHPIDISLMLMKVKFNFKKATSSRTRGWFSATIHGSTEVRTGAKHVRADAFETASPK